jgi:zeta-carotene desaturase
VTGPGRTTVAVVGGGLAGLAAALRLAEAGLRPVVIETRRHLGGRASSVQDPRSGQVIDNCQHVLMGCCTNLIDLYDRLGVLERIERHRTLYWTAGRGEVARLRAGWLPAPFHLAGGLRRLGLFDRAERHDVARAMWKMVRMGPGKRQRWAGRTFGEFLAECRQPEAVVRRFWDVVITSACNLGVARVGAAHALQVFQHGFLEHRWSYTMGLSAVPLVALYDAAREVLERAGGELRLGTSARAIAFDGRRVTGVVTEDGTVDAAAVVSAVPPDRLEKLSSGALRQADTRLRALGAFQPSPILGVHLWFDQPVMDLPHLVVVDHAVQWLFNKGADPQGAQHIHAVISAADEWMASPEEAIVERLVADVHEVLPRSVGLRPVQARCIKEKRATFAATPEAEAHRPSVAPEPARGPAVDNLYLAGDWVDTGWPPTMEGAVRSGYAAASALCRARGIECPGLVEDVPPSWLARRLRGR